MIYIIGNDVSHISSPLQEGDNSWDAELIYFDGWEDAGLANPEIDYTATVPTVIEFVGNLEVLEWSDFPYVTPTLLMMSRQMLDVLLSIQPFKHRLYPTRIYSYGIEELVRESFYGTRTNYQVEEPSLYTDKFVIMQLTEALDVLDEDKTILKSSVLQLSGIDDASIENEFIKASESKIYYYPEYWTKHYEFTRKEKDLPPVFTTPKTSYFFTEAAVRALETNNIRGVEFRPIPQHPVAPV
jgi:hypothetical protein